MSVEQKPTATWNISLDGECPKCHEYVDLLLAPDFWDTHNGYLEIGEHGTERTKNFEACCPECNHEWICELEY